MMIALALLVPLASADFPIGPSAPTNLTASAGPGAGTISLSWGAANSLTGVTAYKVYHVDANGARVLPAAGSTNGVTLTWSESGLGNGATVTYVVTAVDAVQEGPASNSASATTFSAPGQPQGVTATPGALGTVGDVVISWSAPASNGGSAITGYTVYKDGVALTSTDSSTFTVTDSGNTPLSDHHYAVSATNGAGEGAASDATCAMGSPWGFGLGEPACLGLM